MFSEKDGLPKRPFPNGWKGECGLYAVGFTKRGLLGASIDAKKIAEHIHQYFQWKNIFDLTKSPHTHTKEKKKIKSVGIKKKSFIFFDPTNEETKKKKEDQDFCGDLSSSKSS